MIMSNDDVSRIVEGVEKEEVIANVNNTINQTNLIAEIWLKNLNFLKIWLRFVECI